MFTRALDWIKSLRTAKTPDIGNSPQYYKDYAAVIVLSTKEPEIRVYARFTPVDVLALYNILPYEAKYARRALHSLNMICHSFTYDTTDSKLLILADDPAMGVALASDSACLTLEAIGHTIEVRRRNI